MLIAETLLLVAVDDKGRVPIRRRANFSAGNAFMKVGLTGALLAELAIDGQLTIAEYGPAWAGDTRPADELLADVYDAVRNHLGGRKARGVIDGLDPCIGGSWDRVAGRLVAAGVLGRPSALRPAVYPVTGAAVRQAVLERVQMAAAGHRAAAARRRCDSGAGRALPSAGGSGARPRRKPPPGGPANVWCHRRRRIRARCRHERERAGRSGVPDHSGQSLGSWVTAAPREPGRRRRAAETQGPSRSQS